MDARWLPAGRMIASRQNGTAAGQQGIGDDDFSSLAFAHRVEVPGLVPCIFHEWKEDRT